MFGSQRMYPLLSSNMAGNRKNRKKNRVCGEFLLKTTTLSLTSLILKRKMWKHPDSLENPTDFGARSN